MIRVRKLEVSTERELRELLDFYLNFGFCCSYQQKGKEYLLNVYMRG